MGMEATRAEVKAAGAMVAVMEVVAKGAEVMTAATMVEVAMAAAVVAAAERRRDSGEGENGEGIFSATAKGFRHDEGRCVGWVPSLSAIEAGKQS